MVRAGEGDPEAPRGCGYWPAGGVAMDELRLLVVLPERPGLFEGQARRSSEARRVFDREEGGRGAKSSAPEALVCSRTPRGRSPQQRRFPRASLATWGPGQFLCTRPLPRTGPALARARPHAPPAPAGASGAGF